MKKRGILLIAMILLIAFVGKAQDYVRPNSNQQYYTDATTGQVNKKFSLGVSVGPAIPIGDFASTNVKGSFWDFNSVDSTRLQGFAKTGFHFNITASYQLNNSFGVMLLIGSSSNSFDINTFSVSIGGNPAYTSTESFHTAEYLIGPYFTFPIANRLSGKITALVGIATNTYPILDIAVNDTLTDEFSFNGGTGFAYNIGVGLEYKVTDNLSLLLNMSYTGTTIYYSGLSITYSYTGYYPVTIDHPTDETYMSTGIFKPTIGIDYKF